MKDLPVLKTSGSLLKIFKPHKVHKIHIKHYLLKNKQMKQKQFFYTLCLSMALVSCGNNKIDLELNIDADAVDPAKTILPFFGACIEDVNHEIYGGIWSQMIYGESFIEPEMVPDPEGYTSFGGTWTTSQENGIHLLNAACQSNGPKIVRDNTVCTVGEVQVDVRLGAKGGGPAGLIVKTRDARPGANNFIGYEIGLLPGAGNNLRLGRHNNNYRHIVDVPTGIVLNRNTWYTLRVTMTENQLKIYLNNSLVHTYDYIPEDLDVFASGAVGLRTWDCDVSFRNLMFTRDGEPIALLDIPLTQSTSVSSMWRAVQRGTANGKYAMITAASATSPDRQFKDAQSQRMTFVSGEGAIGINNMSLNRKGMNFEAGKDYEGFFYARSRTAQNAYVVLEKSDGTIQYAEKTIAISEDGKWNKYSFTITPESKDVSGRFTIELRAPGTLDIGYAFFQPGEWGRFKGMPFRKDVCEMMLEQKINVLRYGGSMVDQGGPLYRWKNMIGPIENRPGYLGHWYSYSSHGFGIIDFLDLCEALKVSGIPDFHSGETMQDMRDFIDFAIGTDPANKWVAKRIEMGHPKPYDLPYLQWSNEQSINMAYADNFNNMANTVWDQESKWRTPKMILVVGDFYYNRLITDPNKIRSASVSNLDGHTSILKNAQKYGDKEVWFDLHIGTSVPHEADGALAAAVSLYEWLHRLVPGTKANITCFEYNAFSTHSFNRALANAYAINFMQRNTPLFPINTSANGLQVDGHNDNGWDQGLIFMNNDDVWTQPPGYVNQMTNEAYQPYLIIPAHQKTAEIDSLDISFTVARSEDGKKLSIKFVNLLSRPYTILLNIDNFTGNTNSGILTTLTHSDLNAVNTATDKFNVEPVKKALENPVRNSKMTLTLPAKSYITLQLEDLTK